MADISAAEDAGVLWLATLQRALARASHDVKDALNGVSVNLEVVRSRAVRPEAPASAVAQFAEAAGQQLERLTTLIEAVLALGRAEREPVDVATTLQRLATVCGASASSADATVEVRNQGVDATLTRVRGDAVRLAIAAPLLDAVTGSDRRHPASAVVCTITEHEDDIVVTLRAAKRRLVMPDAVADAVRAAGVRWAEGEGGREQDRAADDLSLAFPRA
jgi:light-regulated signal transduction histidine kinase (bacteriophytochrome)